MAPASRASRACLYRPNATSPARFCAVSRMFVPGSIAWEQAAAARQASRPIDLMAPGCRHKMRIGGSQNANAGLDRRRTRRSDRRRAPRPRGGGAAGAAHALPGADHRHGRLLQPRRLPALRRLAAREEGRRGVPLPRVRVRARHRTQPDLPATLRRSARLRGAHRARTGDDPLPSGEPMTHDHSHDHAGVPHQHKARAPAFAKVYVITCSDSRTAATDEGGRIIKSMLADRGHVIAGSAIVPDEPSRIAQELQRAREAGAQVALITGGTGITSRDSTFEAVSAAIARPLPGFGELFRMLSFEELGRAAMLSRAVAGVSKDGLILFAMPGSPAAVRLACERLILPELGHLVEELGR